MEPLLTGVKWYSWPLLVEMSFDDNVVRVAAMNADDRKNNASLIPRQPSSVDKVDPGTKRVLALMVADTLAVAQKHLAPVFTIPTKAELKEWHQQGWKHFSGEGVPKDYS